MRRITPEKVEQVRSRGGKVLTDKGRPFVPRPERIPESAQPVQPVKDETPVQKSPGHDDAFMRGVTGAIVTILKNQDETTKQLTTVIHELSKPKQKKQWGCSVERDSDGKIKTIDITEV